MFGVRGGLAQSNVVGCAIFAAVSGSSTATALTIGTVALPEMRRRGYSDKLTLGTLTGGGCLGILIPPSIPMVIYASVVQESVIDLFMAGLIPGVLLTLMFMAWVAVAVRRHPDWAPRESARPSGPEFIAALRDCAPIIALLIAILGGMYFGIVTPTEAAAFGCFGAALLARIYREARWSDLRLALRNAVVTNAVVMFIIIMSQILSFAFTTTGLGRQVASALAGMGFGPFAFFCVLILLYAILGMFVDPR
jgi:tripartite ATP-independent transporter DctM subunit